MERKIQRADLALQLVYPDAAGIDIGNESHYVPVPLDGDNQSVRHTAELRTMADWLKQCGILTVAMRSTGVYWIPVFDLLEQAGLEVYLVNARETKNLPGRKSDVQKSQWLMKLHTYALFRNSFRPSQHIRRMRTYRRQRKDLIERLFWRRVTVREAAQSPRLPNRIRPGSPGSIRYLLIFSISQSAICGIMTGQYSTAQCSPRPSNHRSSSFAD